jgi:hypothetical protein
LIQCHPTGTTVNGSEVGGGVYKADLIIMQFMRQKIKKIVPAINKYDS